MDSDWLTGWRGQTLAIAATLGVILLLWFGLAGPLLAWHADRAQTLAERRVLADRMDAQLSALPALRRQAEAGAGGRSASSATLTDASDGVGAATLQEKIQAMAAQTGANLTSVETLPAEQVGAWRRIGLRLTLTAPWPVVVRLLSALDQASPRMLVDDLHVHSMLAITKAAAPPLQTTFVVYAFRSGTAP